MGSVKVKNFLLTKFLKQSATRILVIDDNQIRYNEILNIFKNEDHNLHSFLLDDFKSLQKQLFLEWDLIIFGKAYDFTIDQVINSIQSKGTFNTPLFILEKNDLSEDDYTKYIQQGVYDTLNTQSPHHFYISIMRGLNYSRALQHQNALEKDLQKIQLQKIDIAEIQNKAIAILQEGIHIEVNQAYLNLFGLDDETSVIGYPLLDILQPLDINDFKSRFKRVSNGNFDFSSFEIETKNTNAHHHGPLKIEFSPSTEEDSIKIIIESNQGDLNQYNTPTPAVEPSLNQNNSLKNVFNKVNQFLDHHPSPYNALVVFSLASCPDSILTADWKIFKTYFENLSALIRDQVNETVFKIEIALYATIIQAETVEILNSRLYGLQALQKPQLVNIADQNYPQHVKLGYHIFEENFFNDDMFEEIITLAYNNTLSTDHLKNSRHQNILQDQIIEDLERLDIDEPSFSSNLEMDFIPNQNPNDALLLIHLQQALDLNQIQLKYQQIYDKEDTSLNTYEVSCGFVFQNEWISITDLTVLDQNPDLSIKIDRWVLVESCKQLHNFIKQYPHAKLIINLNYHILLSQQQLVSLTEKLISIIGSKALQPIILQFDEETFAQNIEKANQAIQILKDHGADFSIRNFGSASASQKILNETNICNFALDETFTEMLNFENGLQQLQTLIEDYHSVRPLKILLKGLHDMDTFANSWNVDARFLQGDYFQKKLDHLTDAQVQ